MSRREVYLGWGNAFAGGVLLAAGLIHLLGDSADGFAALWPDDGFPWAFTRATLTAFLPRAFWLIWKVRVASISIVHASLLIPQTGQQSVSMIVFWQCSQGIPVLLGGGS